MKMFIPTFSCILIFVTISEANNERHKLIAVTGVQIATGVYRRLREENPSVREPVGIAPDCKNEINHHISRSTYFRLLRNEKIIYTHELYNQLKEVEEYILFKLYKPSPSPSFAPGRVLVYTNPTELIFVCLNQDDSQIIEEYGFIFLTTPTDDSENKYRDNILRDNIDIFGLAEEPAKSSLPPGPEVERVYLERKSHHDMEDEDEAEISICKLNMHQRLRVCTLLLSSSYYREELDFVPDYEFIDDEACYTYEIFFQHSDTRALAGENRFSEQMINCRPRDYYAEFQVEYFVSRARESKDEVFVYRRGPNPRVVLENLFNSVRFITY